MNIIERAKSIISTPKTEWLVISAENDTPNALLFSYVLPLSILASLSGVLRGLLWEYRMPIEYWLLLAAVSFVSAMIVFYIAFYVIDMLAANFGSEKNLNRSAQLVAYSYTAAWVGSFLSFIPYIGWLLIFAGGIYSIYTMYLGLGPMKKTPEDKKVGYLIVSFLIIIVASAIINKILVSIFFRVMGWPSLGGFNSYY